MGREYLLFESCKTVLVLQSFCLYSLALIKLENKEEAVQYSNINIDLVIFDLLFTFFILNFLKVGLSQLHQELINEAFVWILDLSVTQYYFISEMQANISKHFSAEPALGGLDWEWLEMEWL